MVKEGFNLEALRFALRRGRIEWNRHALERMAERGILREEVKGVLLRGERIEDYPDDYPLPSAEVFCIASANLPLFNLALQKNQNSLPLLYFS